MHIFDKKGATTKPGPPAYQFIDILGTAIAEEKIWWIQRFSIKEARDQAAFQAGEKHRAYKEKAHARWGQQCFEYWRDTLFWEFKVIHQC